MAKKRSAKPARETDLYEPVRAYLQTNGYTVRAEVNHCDITAIKGEDLIVIELKLQFGVDLLIQATERRRITDSVYVAVPRPAKWNARWRGIKRLLRQLELGLILVSVGKRTSRVEVAFHPMPYRRQKLKRARRAVLEEMAKRSADHNRGGSTRRKLMTAYRENALQIASYLEQLGPASPRKLRELGTGPKTLSILYTNVYGWFERLGVGVYGLAAEGHKALVEYAEVAEQYRVEGEGGSEK